MMNQNGLWMIKSKALDNKNVLGNKKAESTLRIEETYSLD